MNADLWFYLFLILGNPLVGMVTKPSTEQTQDFSIHNEDFPALPGPNYKDPTLNNDDSKTVRTTDDPTGHAGALKK